MYNKEIMDRFLNPKNAGQIRGASAVGDAQDEKTKEMVKLFAQIDDEEKVVDTKFKVFGSPSLIALCDAVCDMLKGMSVEEMEEITETNIVSLLKDYPEERFYAVFVMIEAINDLIDDYYKKQRKLNKEN